MSRWLAGVLGWSVLALLLAPALLTGWVSFSPDSFLTPPAGTWSLRWYAAFWDDARWPAAVGRSLVVAAAAGVISAVAAAPAALAVRVSGWRGRRWVLAATLLPAGLPPAALGLGVLPLLHWTGLWGELASLVLVHAALGLPVAILIVRAFLTERLDEFAAAARGLGATGWQAFCRVTLPLLARPLTVAGVAVFVLSVNEAVVTLFLATPGTETVPALMWPQLRYAPTPVVAVAAWVTAIIGTAGAAGLARGISLGVAPVRVSFGERFLNSSAPPGRSPGPPAGGA